MTNQPTLSQLLDEAIYNEELHRDQLIHWRQRRQELERQIPAYSAVNEAEQIAARAWLNLPEQQEEPGNKKLRKRKSRRE